jgi:NADH-quinone oxidoreductase subunit I
MPIRDQDVIEIQPTPIKASESMFLPEVFAGLGTTFKHLAGTIFGKRSKSMQYPEERREQMPVEEGGCSIPRSGASRCPLKRVGCSSPTSGGCTG